MIHSIFVGNSKKIGLSPIKEIVTSRFSFNWLIFACLWVFRLPYHWLMSTLSLTLRLALAPVNNAPIRKLINVYMLKTVVNNQCGYVRVDGLKQLHLLIDTPEKQNLTAAKTTFNEKNVMHRAKWHIIHWISRSYFSLTRNPLHPITWCWGKLFIASLHRLKLLFLVNFYYNLVHALLHRLKPYFVAAGLWVFHKVYRLASIPLVLLCVSCVSSSKTFLPDGSEGYVVTCSGSMLSWGDCEAKAGSLCGAGGYEIVSKNANQQNVSSSERSMMIACNSSREPTTTDKLIQKSQEMLDEGVDKGKELLGEGEELLNEGVEKVKELF